MENNLDLIYDDKNHKIEFSFVINKGTLAHKNNVVFLLENTFDNTTLIGSEVFKVCEITNQNKNNSNKNYKGVVDIKKYKLGLNFFVDMFIEEFCQYDINNQVALRTIASSFNLMSNVKKLYNQYVTFIWQNEKFSEIQTVDMIVGYDDLLEIAIATFFVEEYQLGVKRFVFDKYQYQLGSNEIIDKFLDHHQEYTAFHDKRFVIFTSKIGTKLHKATRSDFTNVRNVLRLDSLNDGGTGFDANYDFQGGYVFYTVDLLNHLSGTDGYIDTFLHNYPEYQLYRESN